MEQLEEIRASGEFNMIADWPQIVEYIYYHNIEELQDYYLDVKESGGGWFDLLNELSEYKEIISEFEAEEFEDKLEDI